MTFLVADLDEAFEIKIGSMLYSGWTSADVTRTVSDLAGTFNLTLHDPMMLLLGNPHFLAFSAAAEPGTAVEVWVAGKKFLTGYIDERSANKSAESHDVQLSGRGKARNMVDSSHVDSSTQYNKLKPTQIVEKTAKPFGISVVKRVSGETPIDTFRYFRGDDSFDVAHDAARQQGLTMHDDADGNIVVRDKDNGAAAGALIQGENILTYQVTKSESDRHSEYIGNGQKNPDANNRGKKANQIAAKTEDSGVKSHRPKIVLGESDIDIDKMQKRTTHEAARRAGMSLEVQVTLKGYTGSSGNLWEPDTLAFTYIPDEGIAERLLIQSVKFHKGEDSITTLTLVRKEAFEAKGATGKGQGSKGKVSGASSAPKIVLPEQKLAA